MVQQSRSFGFAETVSKCVAVKWLALGWRAAGEMDGLPRMCDSGYSNLGVATESSLQERL